MDNDEDENIPKNEEGLKDSQGFMWNQKMYTSLLTELQTNIKFRNCVDAKLNINNLDGYDEFMKDITKTDFKIEEKHLKIIESACNNFIELTPDDIKDCLVKLDYVKFKEKLCNGEITLTMIESITLVMEFMGIHIDFNNLKSESIIKLTQLIKQVLQKVITTSEYFEQISCNGNTSMSTKNLKILYNSLFQKTSTKYPFKNMKFDFFDDFTNTIIGKVILLLFIAFIFSRMVDLFGNRGEALQK